MKQYCLTGRRNHGRLLKKLLVTWERNGSTHGTTAWQLYDDDNDCYLDWMNGWILRPENSKRYKITGYRTCQQRISLQNIYEIHIKDISIKYKFTETIKNNSTQHKYTRKNRGLQMGINCKKMCKERPIDISKCLNDTYHNMANIYNLQFNQVLLIVTRYEINLQYNTEWT
jgi:hypothetical protein